MNQIKNNPKVSILVPIHDMENGEFFLWRLVNSLSAQTFTDWELIITKDGKMAENTNSGIKRARGEFIKILYLDDYFSSSDSLQKMVDGLKDGGWLVTGCLHDDGNTVGSPHIPSYNDEIHTGKNTIGSPSVVMFANYNPLLFDEKLSWTLDCDYYKRLHHRYGEPTIISEPLVTLGIGSHQMTHRLTNEEKAKEVNYTLAKHQ